MEKMKNKFFLLYYFALILVLVLYTNTSSSPNTIIRLGYLAALVVPLYNSVALFPAIILCALSISKSTFAYPFMPTEMHYYVILSIVFAALAIVNRKSKSTISALFLMALVYVAMNDLITQNAFSPLVIIVFIMFLFNICSSVNIESSSQLLPLTFVFLSLAISYWVLFCPEAMLTTYNSVDDMEQAGWRDPNYIACTLGLGLVVSVKESLTGNKNKWYLYLMWLTTVLSILALLSMASRGISLAVAASVSVLLLFSNVKKRTKVFSIIAIGIVLVLLYTNEYFDFLIARFNVDDGTGSHRTEIWADKMNAFFENRNALNYFFGFGHSGGFKLGTMGGRSPHNDFVGILIYYGFLGLILFLSTVAYPIRKCSKKDRPQIAALMLYLLMSSMTIEPLCMGNIAYIGFFFYIIQFAHLSKKQENNA